MKYPRCAVCRWKRLTSNFALLSFFMIHYIYFLYVRWYPTKSLSFSCTFRELKNIWEGCNRRSSCVGEEILFIAGFPHSWHITGYGREMSECQSNRRHADMKNRRNNLWFTHSLQYVQLSIQHTRKAKRRRAKIILFFKSTIMPIKRIICSIKNTSNEGKWKLSSNLVSIRSGRMVKKVFVIFYLFDFCHSQKFSLVRFKHIFCWPEKKSCRLYSSDCCCCRCSLISTLSNGDSVWAINFHALFKKKCSVVGRRGVKCPWYFLRKKHTTIEMGENIFAVVDDFFHSVWCLLWCRVSSENFSADFWLLKYCIWLIPEVISSSEIFFYVCFKVEFFSEIENPISIFHVGLFFWSFQFRFLCHESRSWLILFLTLF